MAIERDVYTKADGVKIPIEYVQNTNAIPIIFHFRDFQIPDGATAQVFVQKPSGLSVYNAATISGNDVTVDVTTQMMAEVGFNKLQLQVMSGEDNLVTFVQPVNVRQNYTDGESEESKNESNLFDELQEAAQAANTAAEAANSAAEEIEAKAEAGDFSSTVTVGSTTTGEPGSQASVTNSGTAQNPVLDFVIPTGAQGPQGPKGDPGATPNIQIGTVQTLDPGQQATASMTGTPENPLLNLGIPQGDKGDPGEGSEAEPYELPIMSDTQLGGGKAVSKTDEDVPVAVDPSTGQLFVPTYPENTSSSATPRQEMQNTDTTVTLEPNKLYVFPEMAILTVTLAEPDNSNVANEYHFFFDSGATATTLTLNDVLSDAYSIEANMKYEVSILEGVAYIKGVSTSET